MSGLRKRGKRNPIVIALLSPILILAFIIGWSFYWLGDKNRQSKPVKSPKISQRKPVDNVTLLVIPPQELEIVQNSE